MSSRWLRILALALIVTPVAIPAARTSSPTAADTAPQSPRFSAESEVVVLHVSVTDKKGSYVSGLPQDVFTVLEENHQQPHWVLHESGRAGHRRTAHRQQWQHAAEPRSGDRRSDRVC